MVAGTAAVVCSCTKSDWSYRRRTAHHRHVTVRLSLAYVARRTIITAGHMRTSYCLKHHTMRYCARCVVYMCSALLTSFDLPSKRTCWGARRFRHFSSPEALWPASRCVLLVRKVSRAVEVSRAQLSISWGGERERSTCGMAAAAAVQPLATHHHPQGTHSSLRQLTWLESSSSIQLC
jgi:hypothetical protein